MCYLEEISQSLFPEMAKKISKMPCKWVIYMIGTIDPTTMLLKLRVDGSEGMY